MGVHWRLPPLREKFFKRLQHFAPDHMAQYNGNPVKNFAAVRILVNALAGLHTLWRTKTPLTSAQLNLYADLTTRFRLAWSGLRWKPTVWVHWMAARTRLCLEGILRGGGTV